MARDQWVNLRLTVQYHPAKQGSRACVHYRLMAKPPSEPWTELATVAMGRDDVDGVPWPPSRDDALALMTEVLMGIRWDEPPF